MRAITPPGRTRRYDSRFFVADAEHLSNLDQPHHDGGGELLTLSWLTLDEIASQFNLSRESIRHIEAGAMRRLRSTTPMR